MQSVLLNKPEGKIRDLRLPVAIFALAVLAFYFWLQSRYPALNQKALTGADTPLSGLSFDIIFDIAPGSSQGWSIFANAINWIYTNLKGMTFGVLFGAAALTTLALVQKRAFENGFANSALGTALGAPLGVCVNCAVPIAVGLHMGRMRLETTLSALMASPTLNVIVLSMSFAILPIHMAITKVVIALGIVLVGIPLLCRFVLRAETEATREGRAEALKELPKLAEARGYSAWIARLLTPADYSPENHGLLSAIWWFIRNYARNFLIIFAITVPMMLMAAFLGALIATFVAPNELAGVLPMGSFVRFTASLLIVALIASLVPAPIALDVILTAVLLNIGLRAELGMAALIALGSFSIYVFIVVARVVSKRAALALWVMVIGASVVGGFVIRQTDPLVREYYEAKQIALLANAEPLTLPQLPQVPEGMAWDELAPLIEAQRVAFAPLAASLSSDRASTISVTQAALAVPAADRSGADLPAFARVPGPDIGLAERGLVSSYNQLGYHMFIGGLAGVDVHGDGWDDIVTRRAALAPGFSLYANLGGRFVRQELDLGVLDEAEVYNISAADLNGDGLPDLVASSIEAGAYVLYNQDGTFDAANMVQLKPADFSVMSSIAFADMDDDGDLEIVAGNWAPNGGIEGWPFPPKVIRNQIFWNEGSGEFREQILPGTAGQTLTILAHDMNGDGSPDLLMGDDVAQTDQVLFFDKDGGLLDSGLDTQPFPYYMRTSMSYDVGDWNNDLRDDIYGVQISMASGNATPASDSFTVNLRRICEQFGADMNWDSAQLQRCSADLISMDAIRTGPIRQITDACDTPLRQQDRVICAALASMAQIDLPSSGMAQGDERFDYCLSILANVPTLQNYCDAYRQEVTDRPDFEDIETFYRPLRLNNNLMMTSAEDGSFTDQAVELGVATPGWGWNTRFSDMDQDGRQDLLVVTGIWIQAKASLSNVFYHNTGAGFEDATQEFGFTDIVPSYSYVTSDFDRDGDVDVVRDIAGAAMIVHRNDRPAGRAAVIRLSDAIGNRQGVGARVTICTDGVTQIREGACQMRNVKASGGFMASDPVQAHFGLGDARNVSLIEVRWRDGEVTRILPTDFAGGELLVSRTR